MATDKKTLTCIVCPQGCPIDVWEEKGEIKVSGNACKRGYEYVLEEYKAPKRILTTTIRVKGGVLPVIPVRSNIPIPKEKLFDSQFPHLLCHLMTIKGPHHFDLKKKI